MSTRTCSGCVRAIVEPDPTFCPHCAVAFGGRFTVVSSEDTTIAPGAWIPVSEQLPESGSKVLGYWKNELGKGRRTCCEYVAPRTRVADGFWDDTPDEWFDVDESGTSWVPSGWYERVEGSDEYPYTEVPVTHWQHLPEMPT